MLGIFIGMLQNPANLHCP